jgi:hypothetical protein
MNVSRRLLLNRAALILYCPLSCILIGLLSAYLGPIAIDHTVIFEGGFLSYAIPLPGYPGGAQLLGLVLGFATFILLVLSSNASRPPLSMFHVRMFLITLLALVCLPLKILLVSIPGGAAFQPWVRLIFVAVHLAFAFFATFLPSLHFTSAGIPSIPVHPRNFRLKARTAQDRRLS